MTAKTYNYTYVPPEIQRTGGTFRRHSEASSTEILRNTPRKGFTTVLTGLPNHTEPEYTRRNITCRDYVCTKDTTSFEKLRPKQASLGRTTTVPIKRYNLVDKVFFKANSNKHPLGNWEQSTKELETRHTSFWALLPHIKDT